MQWLMLQQKHPEDFVIATGRQSSVKKFIEICSEILNWGGIYWEGNGLNQVGKRKDNGKIVIKVDSKYFRPSEVDSLLGDPSNAKKKLGWTPSYTLEELAKEMITSDMNELKKSNRI